MNYFINFIPKSDILKKIDKVFLNDDDNIIFNIYIKQLPAMNTDKNLYCDIDEAINYIIEINKSKFKINIIFDIFCFGNKEFTNKGNEIFRLLDRIFKFNIDYITITNNFFFNYVKRRYPNQKIIMSEYNDITNIQKISRYIDDIKADGVKIDISLALNIDKMNYIKEKIDMNNIHVDVTNTYYPNDIFKDSFFNGISHLLQEEKWEEAKNLKSEYEKKQHNKKVYFTDEDYNRLKKLGIKNFWINKEILKQME